MMEIKSVSAIITISHFLHLVQGGSVSLHGGDAQSGIVKVTRGGTTGFICGYNWDSADAKVVCKMLGFSGPSAAIYQATQRFGTPSGVFTVQEMSCTGTENDIEDCPATMGSSCSRVGDVAGVFCFNTPASDLQLALVGGPGPRMGRVELTLGQISSSISSGSNCQFLCKTLGYRHDRCFNGLFRTVEGVKPGYIPEDTGNITMDVKCSYPYADDLKGCIGQGFKINGYQYHTTDVVIHCIDNVKVSLEGGQGSNEGRVIMSDGDLKYTVGIYNLESVDAIVFCRMAGFSGGTSTTKFGPGTGLSLSLSTHKCTGLETSFYDCMSGSTSGDFSISDSHGRDIGVICDHSSGNTPPPQESVVSLVGGRTGDMGAIRVALSDANGYVCGSYYSVQDAQVICRTLGKSGYAVAMTQSQYLFGTPDDGTYAVVKFNCNGNEASIADCPREVGSTCSSFNSLAGVYCIGTPDRIDVRLVNGPGPNFGVIQLTTATITTTAQYTQETGNSKFICHHLGYGGWSVLMTSGTLDVYGEGDLVVTIDDSVMPGLILLRCDGSDETLVDCLDVSGNSGWRISGTNYHSTDTILACMHNYKIELVGGASSSEGRVEVIVNDVRMTMRDHGGSSWIDADARVLCRTAGYEGGTAVALGTYGEGRGITMTGDIRCSGFETKIEDCIHDKAFQSTWMHSEDVGVKCTGTLTPLTTRIVTPPPTPAPVPTPAPTNNQTPPDAGITTRSQNGNPAIDADTTTESPEEPGGLPRTVIIAIAAAGGAVFLIILIILIIVICCCLCRRSPEPSQRMTPIQQQRLPPSPTPYQVYQPGTRTSDPHHYSEILPYSGARSGVNSHIYNDINEHEGRASTNNGRNGEPDKPFLVGEDYLHPQPAQLGRVDSSGGHIPLGRLDSS